MGGLQPTATAQPVSDGANGTGDGCTVATPEQPPVQPVSPSITTGNGDRLHGCTARGPLTEGGIPGNGADLGSTAPAGTPCVYCGKPLDGALAEQIDGEWRHSQPCHQVNVRPEPKRRSRIKRPKSQDREEAL
jgi:hypothetical protein